MTGPLRAIVFVAVVFLVFGTVAHFDYSPEGAEAALFVIASVFGWPMGLWWIWRGTPRGRSPRL